MFEPERKQLLRKTKLSKAVKEINSLELQEKVENRYAKLLAENTLIHPVLKKHLRQSILPAVAVYVFFPADSKPDFSEVPANNPESEDFLVLLSTSPL